MSRHAPACPAFRYPGTRWQDCTCGARKSSGVDGGPAEMPPPDMPADHDLSSSSGGEEPAAAAGSDKSKLSGGSSQVEHRLDKPEVAGHEVRKVQGTEPEHRSRPAADSTILPPCPAAAGAEGLKVEPPSHVVDLALEVSGWSPCRSKRGVVIFDGPHILAHGYNYKPRGFDCDGSEACKATCRSEAIHAEQQALLHAGRSANGSDMVHVKSVGGRLVASGGPSCVQCSKLALVVGIRGVWLYHESGWRRYPADEFHRLSIVSQPSASSLVSELLAALKPVVSPLAGGSWVNLTGENAQAALAAIAKAEAALNQESSTP